MRDFVVSPSKFWSKSGKVGDDAVDLDDHDLKDVLQA